MTRTEDRLTDALGASAHTVREDTLHPPVIAPHRDRRWARWLVPASAAAAVAVVVVLVAALTGSPTVPGPAASGAAGVPRYYIDLDFHSQAVVRSTATGAVTATVPLPAADNGGDGAVTAAANGTFFVAIYHSGPYEQIYQFRLTAAGQVTGFAPVPGGRLGDQAGAMAASSDGSMLAVATEYYPGSITNHPSGLTPNDSGNFNGGSHGGGNKDGIAAPEIVVINVRTGARSVQRGGLVKGGYPVASIESLSWTTDQQLVFAAQWCSSDMVNAQTCGGALHGVRRAAEVWTINPAAGGPLDSGRLLLRQSARYPYIASAQVSPDGQTITALMMHGPLSRQAPGTVPSQLSVVQISAATGRQLRVLYRRPLGPTFSWYLSPDSSGTHWLLDGVDSYGGGDGPQSLSKLGYNGWISGGKLIPLQPAAGHTAGEAW